jgi:heme/copper-type cytochrome/quinol oxidase subunit 4
MLKMILYLHITGGSAALLSMFIPLVTRKGGRAHRRSGWVFVGGMGVVSITALALSAGRYFLDPRPDAKAFALFLFYIAILTGESVSSGIRALRTKDRAVHRTYWWDIGLASLLTLTAVAMAGYGVASGRMLFAWFSIIGLVNGIQGLFYWLRPQTDRMHWWFRHMTSMLGSCIAATTAFLVVNAPLAGVSRGSLIVWITPGVVGGVATTLWTRYYRRRFAKRATPQVTGHGDAETRSYHIAGARA